MGLWHPGKGAVNVITNSGLVGTASPGTGVPSNATTLLDGAVTALITAGNNTQESWGIEIIIMDTGALATASEAALDILIGGATDDVLISALLCGYAYGPGAYHYLFPLHIPSGVRIAARLASVRTSITAQVIVNLYGGTAPAPWKVGSRVTTYGTQVNNARGQSLTVGASGAAYGVTALTANAVEDHFAFLPGFQPENDTTITPNGRINVGIGIGASVEEQIGAPWWFAKDTDERASGPMPAFPCFRDVDAGRRIVMLASNSGANDAGYGGLIYAVS